jgi:flagellar motor switch protein FliN
MSLNSEQEKITNIHDSIYHAVLEGIQSIHGLLETRFDCVDFILDSKYPAELALQLISENVSVQTSYNKDFEDMSLMLVQKNDVQFLVKQLMNHEEAEVELDEFSLSAFSEITNIFFQGFNQNLSSFIGKMIKFDRSKVLLVDQKTQGVSPFSAKVLSVRFNLKQDERLIPINLFFDFASFTSLVEGKQANKNNNEVNSKLNDDIQVKEIRVPKYSSTNENINANPSKNLDLIMNVPLNVSIEIGKTKRKIKDIMSFASGYVLELEKQLGAPVDIVVNGQLIARGDVVVIDENFAIRITEIVSTSSLIQAD